jgi:four helix bundle protein
VLVLVLVLGTRAGARACFGAWDWCWCWFLGLVLVLVLVLVFGTGACARAGACAGGGWRVAHVVLLACSMLADHRMPHEKLLAYQHALQLLQQVQELRIVDARLRDQILRASKSVCLNIAEAVGRFSDADRKRVYAIARGECCEAAAAIDVARATAECDLDRGRAARETAGRLYALLTGLIQSFGIETDGTKMDDPPEH